MSTKVYEAYRVREGHDPFAVLWEIQRRGRTEAKGRLLTLYQNIVDGQSHAAHLKLREQDALFKAWLKKKYEGAEEGAEIPMLREYGEWSKSECPPELKRERLAYPVSNEEVLKTAKRTKVDGDKPGVFDVDAWARAKYGEQITRYLTDLWALDTSVAVRVFRDRHYLIPYCERSSLVGGSLDFMREMEELEDFAYWNNTDPPEEVADAEWKRRGVVWDHFNDDGRWTNFLALEVVSWFGWSDVSPTMDVARDSIERMGTA